MIEYEYMRFGFGDKNEGEGVPITAEQHKAFCAFGSRLEEFLHDDNNLTSKDYRRKWGFRKGSFKALVMFDKLAAEVGALDCHPEHQRLLNLIITKDLAGLRRDN